MDNDDIANAVEGSDRADGRERRAEGFRKGLVGPVLVGRLRRNVFKDLFGEEAESEKIGRYTVREQLGSGGMGTVYEAYDGVLDRKVAVKVLRGEVEWGDRTKREPQALARLSHPNVVQVHDIGEDQGGLYIAMELVDGPTLCDWVKGQRRSWREILQAYLQAGRGLAAAHEAGIIHRDFKPQNALVGRDGRVKVLDFGLARGQGTVPSTEEVREIDPDPASSASLGMPITRVGAVMGTRQYMSPEQYRGEEADERADQFSFCVALYEALYGPRPFAGTSPEALRKSVLEGQIEAAPAGSRVPAWIRRVLEKGLAKDRDDRHESMDALLDRLDRDPARTARRAALAIVLGLLVVTVTALLLQWQREQAEERERVLEAEKDEQERKTEKAEAKLDRRKDELLVNEVEQLDLDTDPTDAIARLKNLSDESEAWESDARMLAADAYHRGVASEVIELPEGHVSHGLSPDGRIVIIRDPESGDVQTFNIDTEETRSLGIAAGGMPEAAFTADGTRMALRLPAGLQVGNTEGFKAETLGASPADHIEIQLVAGGGVVTYGRDPELHHWAGGTKQVFGGHSGRVESVAVHPLGTSIATVDSYGKARLWDLAKGAPTELAGIGPVAFSSSGRLAIATTAGDVDVLEPTTMASVRCLGRGIPVEALAFAPGTDGLAAGFGDGEVAVWDPASYDRKDLPAAMDEVESLRFVDEATLGVTSQAGLTLYDLGGSQPQTLRGHSGIGSWTVRDDDAVVTLGREGKIRVWDLERVNTRALAGHVGAVERVAYTPSDAMVTGGADGLVRVWSTVSAGVKITDHETAPIMSLAVSHDGRSVASGDQVGRVLVSGPGERVTHTEVADVGDEVLALAWSADGRLAIARPEGGLLVLKPADPGSAQKWETGGLRVQAARFSLDDQRVAVVGWSDDGTFVVVLDSRGEEESRYELEGKGIDAVGFSRDDRYVAFSRFNRSVWLLNLNDGTAAELGQHAGRVFGVCFAPNSRTVATAGEDGVVKLWDVDWKKSRTVSLTDRRLRGIAFRYNGNEFVAVGDEATAFFGRDDLPWDAIELQEWVENATTLTVDPEPIEWSPRRRMK